MAQFSRRSFHVLATTTVLAADRARGWVPSRFILPSGALAGVAWSGVEQLPDSSHFMSVRRAFGKPEDEEEGGTAMKNRRSSEKPDEYPQARQLSPPLLRAGTWTSCARPRRSGSSIHAVIWESHRAYIRQNC